MNLQKLKLMGFLAVGAAACFGLYYFYGQKTMNNVDPKYANEITEYRAQAEARLRAPDGWLSVVGLTWLREGVNSIGSDKTNDVVLPASAPSKLGEILFSAKTGTQFVVKHFANTLIDDQPAQENGKYEMADDTTEKPTKVKVGSVSFVVIKRLNGYGIRVRDSESANRLNFKGRDWYPPKQDYIVDGEWIAHDKPRKMAIPDILGNMNQESSPGFVRFKIDSETVDLHPTQSDDGLFFIFRDGTSGSETYGAARFLAAELPKNGRVTLDFNKAVNPPCAFTEYATCPLPPKENIIKIAIRAGELKPIGSTH